MLHDMMELELEGTKLTWGGASGSAAAAGALPDAYRAPVPVVADASLFAAIEAANLPALKVEELFVVLCIVCFVHPGLRTHTAAAATRRKQTKKTKGRAADARALARGRAARAPAVQEPQPAPAL